MVPMSSLSRRNFLHAGGAVAASAVVLAGPLSHAAATGSPASAAPEVFEAEGEDQMLMYVSNTGDGEIVVMTDGHEVVFHDPQLVARVQRAAKKAGA
jgi:TAT (twin-arginine translocation) pathway signal sequence